MHVYINTHIYTCTHVYGFSREVGVRYLAVWEWSDIGVKWSSWKSRLSKEAKDGIPENTNIQEMAGSRRASREDWEMTRIYRSDMIGTGQREFSKRKWSVGWNAAEMWVTKMMM